MLGFFSKIACWAVDRVLGAEKSMSGKSGKEKRAAVVSMLEKMIPLPQKLEGIDDALIGVVVDWVCDTMNWLTDYDFSKTELDEAQKEKVAAVSLNASVASVADTTGKSVNERLDALYKQYGIEKPAEPEPVQEPEAKPGPVQETAQTTSPANENWERSIAFSLKYEGGRNFEVVNGKAVLKTVKIKDKSGKVVREETPDLGGATAYGITIQTLKAAYASGVVKHADICKLTQDEAKLIYKKNFWERYGWGELAWPVCLCCLDCCINHGGFAWILQRAAVECGQRPTVDGKFGPQTFAAVKACDPLSLSAAIVRQRKRYYENIVASKPSQKVFLKGWLARNDAMAKIAGV